MSTFAATALVGGLGSAWALSRAVLPVLWRAVSSTARDSHANLHGGRSWDPSGSTARSSGNMSAANNEDFSRATSVFAIALLQIGIIGMAFCFVAGIIMMFVARGQARKSVMDRTRAQGKLSPQTLQEHDSKLQLLRERSPEFAALVAGNEAYTGLAFGDQDAAADAVNQNLFLLQLTSIFAAFGAAVVTAISSVASTVVSTAQSVWGNKEIWLLGGTVAAALTVLLNFSDVILSSYRLVWAYNVRPVIFETFLFPLLALVVTGVNLVLPFIEAVYGSYRLSQIIPLRIIKRLAFDRVGELFTQITRTVVSFVTALVQWGVSSRASLDNIPLIPFVQDLQNIVHSLYQKIVKVACPIVDYILGPIDVAILHVSLTRALNGLINAPVVAFQQLVLQPLQWNNRPDMRAFIDQYTVTVTNVGYWVENITLAYADRYIGGGIGNISILMDQGQLPPNWDQFDGFAYTVRAFRMDIFGTLALFSAVVFAAVAEVIKIIINTDVWFTRGGYTFWTLEDLWTLTRNLFEAAGTIVNVFPQCVVDGTPAYSLRSGVYYGDIVSGAGRTLVGGAYFVKDTTIGTVYTLLEGTQKGPFHYTAGYLLADGQVIQEIESQTNRFARAVGCIFAQLDPSLGNTLSNTIVLVLNSFVFLVISFVTYVGYAFEQPSSEFAQPADVLDNLDPVINNFERDALGLTGLFGFIYRWAGTDARGCLSTISPLCGLGQLLSRILEFFVRAACFVLRIVKNTVKVLVALVTNLITRGALDAGRVTQLSTKALSRSAYLIGRFAGVLFGSLIAVPLPCHEDRPNFCAARGYDPVPSPQTPTICLSTFSSLAGSALIGAPVEITLNLLEIGANFQFTDLSDDGVFVKFVRDLMRILKERVAAPVLPLGIFLDCWVSALIQPSDAVSKILGLIYDSFVNFVDKLGPVFIRIIQLIVKVLSVLFGGKITAALIGSIITDLFNIWLDGLVEFAKWAFGFVLGFILDFIEGACSFFNNQACLEWIRSVRGSVTGFLGLRGTRDYLRDLGDTVDGKRKRAAAEKDDSGARNRPLFPRTASTWERLNAAHAEQEARTRSKTRAAFAGAIDELFAESPACVEALFRSFGYVYSDAVTNETKVRPLEFNNMPTHMATYVTWTPGTMAAVLMASVNGTTMDKLDPGTFVWFYMFVSLRTLAVLVAATVPGMAWLPDDVFYNVSRIFMVGLQMVRSILVFLQYFSDRSVPHEKVMSKSYQEFWAMLTVNVSHYDHEFRSLYPLTGANASAVDLIPFEQFRGNLTLLWYYARNFVDDDVSNSMGNGSRANGTRGNSLDTFSNSVQRLWTASTDFLWFGVEKQINYTTDILNTNSYRAITGGVDLPTNMSLSDGSAYSVQVVYRQDNVTNTRYEVWRKYGDSGVNVHDTRMSYLGLYMAVADFMQTVMKSIGKAVSAYTDVEVDFMDTLSDDYRRPKGEDADLGGASPPSTPPTAAAADPAPGSSKRSAETTDPASNSDAQALTREERVARRRAIEERRRHVPLRPRFSWPYLAQVIARGYAEYVDSFMHNNNATLPTWGDGVHFNNRTRVERVLVTAVAATAAYFELNTSYVPVYCNTSDSTRELCARADWRNAALYLQNDTQLHNLFVASFNSSAFGLAWLLQPRSQQAAHARTFTGRLITGAVDFVGEIVGRFQSKFAEYKLWEEFEAARLLFRQEYAKNSQQSDARQDAESTRQDWEAEFEQAFVKRRRALQEHFERTQLSPLPGAGSSTTTTGSASDGASVASAGDQPARERVLDESLQRIIKFYTDQKWNPQSTDPRTGYRRLEDQETYWQFMSQQTYGLRSSSPSSSNNAGVRDDNNDALMQSLRTVIGADPFGAWQYWYEQSSLKSPERMRMARPPQDREAYEAAALNGSRLTTSVLRAWTEWIQEERAIESDRFTYRSMFVPVSELDPEQEANVPAGLRENAVDGALSNIVSSAVRTMKIESRTHRRQLIRRVLNVQTEAEAHELADSSQVHIRAYKRATLARVQPTHKRSSSYPNAHAEWKLVDYDAPSWLRWATGRTVSQLDVAAEAHATATGTLDTRSAENVVEIRIAPTLSPGDHGLDTVARSHFFFPTSVNASIDEARSTLECAFPDSFICDPVNGCPIVANTFDAVKGQILAGIDAYVNWVPPMVAANVGFLNYVANKNATARIGYGSYPPRLFARGFSFWYAVRGLPSEVEGVETGTDGPKWSTFFDQLTQGTSPFPTLATLWTNGTNYQDYLLYKTYRDAGNVSLVFPYNEQEAYYAVLYVIQEGLGLKMLQFIDTVVGYTSQNIPYFAEYAFRAVKCDYRQDLDCSVRTMSLVGALYKWATLALAIVVITFVITSGNFLVVLPLLSFLLMLTPYIVSFLAYGYSMACFPLPPRCLLQEAFDLAVYTLEPRCGMLEGTLVQEDNYNANTCYRTGIGLSGLVYNITGTLQNPAYTFTDANCVDYGFRNEYDGLTVQYLIYKSLGRDIPLLLSLWKGAIDSVYALAKALFGDSLISKPVASRAWTSNELYRDNYLQSNAAFSIWNACSNLVLAQQTSLVALKAAFVATIASPAASAIVSILQSLLPLLASVALIIISAFSLWSTKTFQFGAYNSLQTQLQPGVLETTIFAPLLAAESKAKKLEEKLLADDDDDDDAGAADANDDDDTDRKRNRRQKRDSRPADLDDDDDDDNGVNSARMSVFGSYSGKQRGGLFVQLADDETDLLLNRGRGASDIGGTLGTLRKRVSRWGQKWFNTLDRAVEPSNSTSSYSAMSDRVKKLRRQYFGTKDQ